MCEYADMYRWQPRTLEGRQADTDTFRKVLGTATKWVVVGIIVFVETQCVREQSNKGFLYI